MSTTKACIPLVALVGLAACGGDGSTELLEGIGEAAAPIMDGYLDHADTYAVGIVRLSNQGIGGCSGTLIAPNVVLTAHHCVAGSSSGGAVICGSTVFFDPYPANELYVTTRTSFTQNPADYHFVREVLVPPGGDAFCGNDVALMILESPILASEAVPAVPRVDLELFQYEEYYAIGFGAQSDSDNADSGTRFRRDQLFTQCVGAGCGLGSGITQTEWRGDAGICQGDSGGGAFDLFNRVHGVASRGSQGCAFPVYGGVYGWADWIKESTVYASGLASLEPPPWANGHPTDPQFNHPVGAACDSLEACPSGACLNGYCTRACGDLAGCPEGYQCSADFWCEEIPEPVLEDEATPARVVSGGCTLSAPRQDPTKPIPWEIVPLGLGAAAFVLRRRDGSTPAA